MVTKTKRLDKSGMLGSNEDELIEYQRLVKELNYEPERVWIDTINPLNARDAQKENTNPWVDADNNDALSEYMDDVSEYINPEDISDLEW